jgi:hypothetical protein
MGAARGWSVVIQRIAPRFSGQMRVACACNDRVNIEVIMNNRTSIRLTYLQTLRLQ